MNLGVGRVVVVLGQARLSKPYKALISTNSSLV